jgi:hypothetical protein
MAAGRGRQDFSVNNPCYPDILFSFSKTTLNLVLFTVCCCVFSDVISTVGPQGEYPGVLEAAYKSSLALMMNNKLRSVVRTRVIY